MLRILKAFWRATAEVFDDAWGLSPRQSRLMHGAGIIGVGLLMDAISEACHSDGEPTYEIFREGVGPTERTVSLDWRILGLSGTAVSEGGMKCRTHRRDIQLLAMHLLDLYQQVSQPIQTPRINAADVPVTDH